MENLGGYSENPEPLKYTLAAPPPPKWEWCVGGDWYSMTVRVHTAPHALGRFLMRHLLGTHWRPVE